MDRIDIIVEVPALAYDELRRRPDGESSETIRQRVNRAREVQRKRFSSGTVSNANMSPRDMERYCSLTPEGDALMKDAFHALGLGVGGGQHGVGGVDVRRRGGVVGLGAGGVAGQALGVNGTDVQRDRPQIMPQL